METRFVCGEIANERVGFFVRTSRTEEIHGGGHIRA